MRSFSTTNTYKNKFHNKNYTGSQEYYPIDPKAESYKGFTIHKVTYSEFHVVKNGVCVGMYGSVRFCKKTIDENSFYTKVD